MNDHDNITHMLEICQASDTVRESAQRLVMRFENNIKRAFGSGGTVNGKLAMIDHFRSELAQGLALLVIIAQPQPIDLVEVLALGEQLGTVRHDDTDLGEVIGEKDGATIRKLPDDIATNVAMWSLTPPPDLSALPDVPDLPPIGEMPDVPDLPPIPPDVPDLPPIGEMPDVPDLPPIPAHPTQRDHPARPGKGRRKPQ